MENLNYDVNLDRNIRKKLFFGKICAKYTKGEDCKECAESDRYYRLSRNVDNQKEKDAILEKARELFARSKIFINAINVKDEDKEFPGRVYAVPPSVYDDLMGQIKGLKQLDGSINVFHPLEGRNILVSKKGSGIQTRYTVQIDQKSSKIPNAKILESLKKGDVSCLNNLDEIESFVIGNSPLIAIFDSPVNIIRLLPPYDGQTIYKELKFHRFSADSVASQNTETTPKSEFDNMAESGFNPFDLTAQDTIKNAKDLGEGDASVTDATDPELEEMLNQMRAKDDIPF